MREIILFSQLMTHDTPFVKEYAAYKEYYFSNCNGFNVYVTLTEKETLKSKISSDSSEFISLIGTHLVEFNNMSVDDRIDVYVISMFKRHGFTVSYVDDTRPFKIQKNDYIEKIVYPEDEGFIMI